MHCESKGFCPRTHRVPKLSLKIGTHHATHRKYMKRAHVAGHMLLVRVTSPLREYGMFK